MALGDKIDARLRELESEQKSHLRLAAEAYGQALHTTLGEQGTRQVPSRPGEPPHRVSGRLQASIEVVVDEGAGVAEVRCTVPYAAPLARTRPFYRLAWVRARDEIGRILFGRK